MVPVSVRSEDEHGQAGNKLATMRAPLPVYEPDPIRRLEIVITEKVIGTVKNVLSLVVSVV